MMNITETYNVLKWIKGMAFILVLVLNFYESQAKFLIIPKDTTMSLRQYLEASEEKLHIRFYFRDEWLDTIQVNPVIPVRQKEEVFRMIKLSGLEAIAYSDWQYILIWEKKNPVFDEYDDKGNFNREISLSGKVFQMNTEEELIGASVQVDELDTGTITDQYGSYVLHIPTGFYTIRANSVGQQEEIFRIRLTRDTTLNFELADKIITLSEVVVSDEAIDQNVNEVTTGKTRLDMLTIRGIPAFMGEVDVVRSLLMMPGVSSVGEGATGFNVRGGTVDQNLVMIDHTPVFNTSHLFGLFSVFNQDMIQDVTLYKGGIPARYGGRLSSVLDIRSRENQAEKFSGRGGIGLIASRLSLDIPLIKEKMSLSVGGRGSYSDYLLRLIPDPDLSNSSAYFYDANLKYNYLINNKNTVRVSYYKSFDRFRLPSDTAYFWGTDNLSLQWNHLFGENLVGNFTGAYSLFRYGVESTATNMGYRWKAGLEFRNLKVDFIWLYPEGHQLGFGGSFINYIFNSGDLIPDENSSINPILMQDDQSYESAVYVEDEWGISQRISLMAGLRYSYYQAIGPSDVNIYQEGQPLKPSTLLDVQSFDDGQVIKSYSGWEPRLALRIGFPRAASIKLSYNRMYQYIHLISNTTAVTPIDIWHASNLHIRPQHSDQYSLGYFRNFIENTIETSVEVFYKDIFNIIDYKDGAKLLLNENIEEELLQGHGRAYGVELLIRKKLGRLTGWVGYTYSKTEKKMKSPFEEETINFGKYYPASIDRPHNLSITADYKFTRRWSMSANFVFMSGRPGTFPESKYIVDRFTVAGYGERNQNRIPDYHRLDISFTLGSNLRKNKKWNGSWTFSVYNVYSRNNAYSVYFKAVNSAVPQAYKLSVLGAAFPAITYNFNF